jgi:hypothetical protein
MPNAYLIFSFKNQTILNNAEQNKQILCQLFNFAKTIFRKLEIMFVHDVLALNN